MICLTVGQSLDCTQCRNTIYPVDLPVIYSALDVGGRGIIIYYTGQPDQSYNLQSVYTVQYSTVQYSD